MQVTGEQYKWRQDNSQGHGTHIAGTISSVGWNRRGVTGILPADTPLHIVSVRGASTPDTIHSSDILAGMQRCQAAGAKVISTSLGYNEQLFTPNAAYCASASRLAKQGILMVAGAGAMRFPMREPVVSMIGY